IIDKRGSYYYYDEDQIAQGRENAKQALRENLALCLEIENAIRQQTGLPTLDTGTILEQLEEEDVAAELEEEESEESEVAAAEAVEE
ncbi:MAG: hypothetical protein PVG11_06745, partial [Anaerolineae bacterium]